MALSTATISYDISDLVGTDFDARRTKVWVSTNVPDDTIIDTVGNAIRVGDGLGTVAEDGTGSVAVWIPGTGSNPDTWQTTVHLDYAPRRPGATRVQRTFGPFTVSASANLADLVEEQEVPPTYLSQVTSLLDGYVADAQAAAAVATAASVAVDSIIIDDLGTSDGQVEALVASPTSLTRAALDASYVRGIGLSPSGDTTGDTDTANWQAAIDAAMPTAAAIYPAPGLYYINDTLVLQPSNNVPGDLNAPAMVPSIISLTSAGRIGDLTSDTSTVQLVATADFPLGQFLIDYRNDGGVYSGSGAVVRGLTLACTYRAAGFRAQGPRKFHVTDLTIDKAAAPVSPGDGSTGAFSITVPAIPAENVPEGVGGADGGAYCTYDNITVNQALRDSFCHLTRSADTFLGCHSLGPARYSWYFNEESDAKVLNCGYEQGVSAVYCGPASTIKVTNMSSYAGGQLSPSGNAVIIAAGRGADALRYPANQFIGCDFGNSPASPTPEKDAAVVLIEEYAPGLVQNAIFSACTFFAGPNTSEWVHVEAGVVGNVRLAACEFNGSPVTVPFRDLSEDTLRVTNAAGLALSNPLGTPVSPPAGLGVTQSGTPGSTSYAYRVSATNQYGETEACALVATATGNATLSGSNYNALSWSLHPANLLSSVDTSFETGVGGFVDSIGRCTVSNSSAQAHSGGKSVLFDMNEIGLPANNGVASWDFGVLDVGTTYCVSAWVYVPSGNTCGFGISIAPGGSGGGIGHNSATVAPGAGWTRVFAFGTTVTSAATSINLITRTAAIASGDKVYIDDIQLEVGTTPLTYQRIGYSVYGRVAGAIGHLTSKFGNTYNDTGAASVGAPPPNPGNATIPPLIPATGLEFVNPFSVDADVYFTGGTITGLARNGVTLGTTGPIRVRGRDSITVSYTSLPNWLWIPA